ncbi:MAG: hypothetical protein JXL97_01645 [Bacteroidales bacterium]|nr:hypothetical protein [Bacteroidales bacterium]
MQRNFFEHNQLRKELIERFSDAEKLLLVTEEDKFDYIRYLLFKIGKSYHISSNIKIEKISNALKKWFEDEHKLEVDVTEILDVKILFLKPKKGIAKFLGISKPMALVLDKNTTCFSFMFLQPEWFEEPKIDPKNEKSGFFSNLFVDNIEKFIFEFVHENESEAVKLKYVSNENYFVENLTSKYQQFILTELQENEVLLAWLNVSAIKSSGSENDFYKKITWFYILTNFDALLIGFDKNGSVIDAIDLKNRNLTVKKSIRNSIIVDEYEWTPSLTNSTLYSQLEKIVTLENKARIKEIAELNVKNSKTGFKHYGFAKLLLTLTNDITDPLTIFLLNFIEDKQKATKEYSEDDKLNKLLLELLNQTEAEEQLTFWFNDWLPNVEQGVFIVKMLLSSAENLNHLKKILPLHKLVHQLAVSKEKDLLNIMFFDIEYCKHLIVLEKYNEAEKILSANLKKLPDQEVGNLLPSEHVDPTGHFSGQFLKVILLELLAKTQNKEDAELFTKQVAELQPLAINRIYKLTGVNDETLKNKANVLLKILKEEGLSAIETYKPQKTNSLEKKDLELLKHPSLRKKGALNSFQKWVSAYKKPDFSAVKSYAENFSPVKYEQVGDIIADLLHFFGFSSIEVFISHGNDSVGIKAYEGDVSFLVIGSEHLNPDSLYFLTYNELRFVIATEFAYLYFNFARITSNDVWRGAMDKGNIVVNTLIDLIPFAGGISLVAKNAAKIKIMSNFLNNNQQITQILSKAGTIANFSNKSEGILHLASQLIGSVNIPSAKDDSSNDQLIAVSRMMQISADRVGILFNNDPVSAVRAIFLTSKELTANLQTVHKYGLNSFLLKKDDQNNFINQNFAVRFASMFSFWLSDDFETLRKKLIEKS